MPSIRNFAAMEGFRERGILDSDAESSSMSTISLSSGREEKEEKKNGDKK